MPAIETASQIDLLYGSEGPTAKQETFRDDCNRYKLYGGAVGGGKSWALSAEGLRLSLAYPGNRGFMCRDESTAFKNTTLATLIKLIGEVETLTGQKIMSNHHKTDRKIWFINGSCIMYGSLGDAQDFERIKSLEVGWFAIDEASETPLDNFNMLKSRLRWRLPDKSVPPYFGLLASNPEAGWVKDTFVTRAQMGESLPNHSFTQALPSDNPHLPPGYVEDLRSSNPAHWVKRYLEGSWDALEGQIWSEYDTDIHVINDFKIPENWTKFRAIDHGRVNPTCCLWFAVDGDGNLYTYREYYKTGIVSNHCETINKFSKGEEYTSTYLDPSCWGRTMEKNGRLWSIKNEYSEYHIYCTKANNEVLAGLNRVSEYLLTDRDRIHPITEEKGSPRIFIFKSCVNLQREIPNYVWHKGTSDLIDKERPVKKNDHGCDALRYGIMSRPSPKQMKSTGG